MPIIAERCRAANMAEADGFWTYPEIAKAKGTADNVFLDGYLSSPDALPVSKSDETCNESIRSIRVEGGRNSAFYTAHSYHTKVPPEAILPFIEHYSKPGDVVLGQHH